MMGRRTCGGSDWTRRNVDPKMRVKMIGLRSIIFDSGARVSERKHATVIAEACSEIQGICFSMKMGARCGAFIVSTLTAGCLRLLPVKCPVYSRTAVL